MDKKLYKGYISPGNVFGPIYFAGVHSASTHIIDTGEGLILIDPGFPETLWIVLDNIKELGFSPSDIKKIVISHGHYDHAGGTKELAALTGAKTYLGKDDLKMVTGEEDTALSEDPDYRFKYSFTPDVLLSDTDRISLGNTEILCLSTPGHTDGTMSFFFDVSDGDKTYRAGMFGGAGLNTLSREFLQSHGLPLSNRDKFIKSIERLKKQKVEVFLGNHVGNNDTEGKLLRVAQGEKDAFLAPDEWQTFLDGRITELNNLSNSN